MTDSQIEEDGDDATPPRPRVERLPGPLDAVDLFIPKTVFVLGMLSATASLLLAITVKDSTRWYFLILAVAMLGYFGRQFYLNWSQFTTSLRQIEEYGRAVKAQRNSRKDL